MPTYMGMQMLPLNGVPADQVVMWSPRQYGKSAAQRAAMLGYGFGMGKDKLATIIHGDGSGTLAHGHLAEYAKRDADMAMYGDGVGDAAEVQRRFNKAVNWPLHYDNNEGDNDNL